MLCSLQNINPEISVLGSHQVKEDQKLQIRSDSCKNKVYLMIRIVIRMFTETATMNCQEFIRQSSGSAPVSDEILIIIN